MSPSPCKLSCRCATVDSGKITKQFIILESILEYFCKHCISRRSKSQRTGLTGKKIRCAEQGAYSLLMASSLPGGNQVRCISNVKYIFAFAASSAKLFTYKNLNFTKNYFKIVSLDQKYDGAKLNTRKLCTRNSQNQRP